MKTVRYLILTIATVAFASCTHKSTPTETSVPPIDVAEVQVDSIMLSKSYPGVLKAVASADIVSRVNGYLRSQNYQDGANVHKGQVLFTIENTKYRDAVTQAQAALENARSAYAYASKNYEAMEKAFQSDAVAQIQVLQSKNALEQAEAQIKNCEAALEIARTNLSYCTITAPFDGQVDLGIYSVGQYIGGEGQPVTLATIYDNSHMKAEFYIEDASYVRSLANENNRSLIDYNNVPVSFSEQLPHTYAGKLNYISPDINTGTGTMMLRVLLDSPYGELRDGMYCTVDLPYKIEPRAVLIKDAAISTSQSEKFVYVVNDSNRVVYTPIQVGEMANDSMRIVTSGLSGGEKYVTKALLKVRSGMEVKPILTK